uniref:Uncharacterized protein n=1 Tax=Macrococcoides canis TaxID=1855823 RepID=A0A4Y1NNG5_9STAP|nr:hypothetical protein [Macrococcus canis]
MWYQISVFDATEKCDLGGLVYCVFMVLLERRFQSREIKTQISLLLLSLLQNKKQLSQVALIPLLSQLQVS